MKVGDILRRAPLLVGLVVLVVGASCAGLQPVEESAQAKKTVVLLEFRGPEGAKVRDAVMAALTERYQLVPDQEYQRAARRLKARRMRPAHVAKVAEELGIDAVIHGKIRRRRGRRLAVVVTVRDGTTGEVLTDIDAELERRKVDEQAGPAVRDKLMAVVDEIAPRPTPSEPPADNRPGVGNQVIVDKGDRPGRTKQDTAGPPAHSRDRAKPRPKAAAAEPAAEPSFELDVDDRGQVIDDEAPPMKPARYH
jgi:TolB-like protein